MFIPENKNIEEEVAKAMEPFSTDLQVKPWKSYLGTKEIAAMAKHYGVRKASLLKLAPCMEDWNGGMGGVDAKGLFAVHTYNPDAKWDWYEIGGRWNGSLPGNAVGARSLLLSSPKLLRTLLPHDFLTPDGRWHEKSTFHAEDWLGGKWRHKSEAAWLEEFQAALQSYADYCVVGVDRHF